MRAALCCIVAVCIFACGDTSSTPDAADVDADGDGASLDGLQVLETIESDFTLWRATQLTSLDALTSLTTVGLVDIDDNPLLSQCEVEAFAASLAATCDCEGNATCP
jgi:hypothetical protein